MGRMVKKNLDRPDQHIVLPQLFGDAVQVGDATIARTQMLPRACCSLNTGNASCKANHAGVVLSGQMRVETDEGTKRDGRLGSRAERSLTSHRARLWTAP